jgi:hypothetical protein
LRILNFPLTAKFFLFFSFLLFETQNPLPVDNSCADPSFKGAMSGPPINQQRVILGPLTTTWTAPSSCSVAVQECQTCTQAWAAQTCFASSVTSGVKYSVEDNTDCWPPRSSFVGTPVPPLAGWGFYSPGLECPYEMTSACSATGGGSSGWDVQFGLLTKETAVGCCPKYQTDPNQFLQL